MPSTPPRPCRYPGCSSLITTAPAKSTGYCGTHAASAAASEAYQRNQYGRDYDRTTRRTNPALAFAASVRNSPRWRAVRLAHKQQSPLCCDPYRTHSRLGLPGLATHSHHIRSLARIFAGEYPAEYAFDLSNLAGLCPSCHGRIERDETKGIDTAAMFHARETANT